MRGVLLVSLLTATTSACVAQQSGDSVSADRPLLSKQTLHHMRSGSSMDQFELAHSYRTGQGIPKDSRKAFAWYKKAADRGHTGAMTELGRMYLEGLGVHRDYQKAFEWFQRGAMFGNPQAQFNLGLLYFNGLGVPSDLRRAIKWWDPLPKWKRRRARFGPSNQSF